METETSVDQGVETDTFVGQGVDMVLDQAHPIVRGPLKKLTETGAFKDAVESTTNVVNNAIEDPSKSWEEFYSSATDFFQNNKTDLLVGGATFAFGAAMMGPIGGLLIASIATGLKSIYDGDIEKGQAQIISGVGAALTAKGLDAAGSNSGLINYGGALAAGLGLYNIAQNVSADAFKQDELAGVDPRLAHVERTLT